VEAGVVRRLLVTGSRDWTNERAIYEALEAAVDGPDWVIVHGAARGADTIADLWAKMTGYEVEPHPADWGRHGKAAGPIRNQEMVALGADLCLAFPVPGSRGTLDCIERARAAHIPVREVWGGAVT
jgi:hypothetical protein